MPLTAPPVARTSMRIRRPVADVFEAFVNPDVTSKFWFTRGSERLTEGALVIWHWDMYGFAAEVRVTALELNRRIVVEWPTPVEWLFAARPDGTTFVTITASGFAGTDDQQVTAAIDSMGGFSFTLAACKAWLEHGIELNIVADHSPDSHVAAGDEPGAQSPEPEA